MLYCVRCEIWYHQECLRPAGNLQWFQLYRARRLPWYLKYPEPEHLMETTYCSDVDDPSHTNCNARGNQSTDYPTARIEEIPCDPTESTPSSPIAAAHYDTENPLLPLDPTIYHTRQAMQTWRATAGPNPNGTSPRARSAIPALETPPQTPAARTSRQNDTAPTTQPRRLTIRIPSLARPRPLTIRIPSLAQRQAAAAAQSPHTGVDRDVHLSTREAQGGDADELHPTAATDEPWRELSDDEDDVRVYHDTEPRSDRDFHTWKSILAMPIERGAKADIDEAGVGSYERIIVSARKLRNRPKDINAWLDGVLERKYETLTADTRGELKRRFERDMIRDPAARPIYVCPNKHLV